MNNLELSPALLAALYSSSLVIMDSPGSATVPVTAAAQPAEETKKEPVIKEDDRQLEWNTLGDNNKKILVAVNYADAKHLPDDELSFLTNMLTACKLSLADVMIINLYHHKGFVYKDLLNHAKSNKVFLFGIEPVDFGLPMSFPIFQVQSFSGVTYLFAPSLAENRQDKLLKSKLWVCLQRIFAI
jgi:hypothetical protein